MRKMGWVGETHLVMLLFHMVDFNDDISFVNVRPCWRVYVCSVQASDVEM